MRLKMKIKLVIAMAYLSLEFQGRGNLDITYIYEKQLGLKFAAENFNGRFHLLDYKDALVTPKKMSKMENDLTKVINPIFRFSKLFFTNYLISDYAMTMNHERFGHGYRTLESAFQHLNQLFTII